jgi:EAL and modified HD-GYP domain-containing signal transduction protein
VVIGYELLVGADDRGLDPGRDPKVTSALLIEAFGDVGLDVLAGCRPAWVSIARNFLVEVGPPPFRPDRAVLQIAAYPARDDLMVVLQTLGRSGYAIALADYDGRSDVAPLLALCSIVKVDVRGCDERELRDVLRAPAQAGALLVAKGVADAAAFERCVALGFTYFQGEFFARPRVQRHRGVATGGLAALRALGEITRPEVTFEALERVITADVGLSLKLLRYVNSAFFALPRTIGSVREALTMLGARTVKRWATVMVLSAVGDASSELVEVALQRARMCELLAGPVGPEEKEGAFTAGLFSVADALLEAPMETVLETLPFSDELRAALLRHEGTKGELLATVIAYERGEFPPAPAPAAVSPSGAYRASLAWAGDASRAVAG